MKGFTREVLIALVANIETREWRRTFNREKEFHLSTQDHPPPMMSSVFLVFFETMSAQILPLTG